MVRLRVNQLLKKRGWTPYRLAKESGLTFNQAYRVARPDGRFEAVRRDTLECVCAALGVEPSAIFERTERAPRRTGRKKAR
jgi:DNA-binding Xre family transcriptional regulator